MWSPLCIAISLMKLLTALLLFIVFTSVCREVLRTEPVPAPTCSVACYPVVICGKFREALMLVGLISRLTLASGAYGLFLMRLRVVFGSLLRVLGFMTVTGPVLMSSSELAFCKIR